MGESLLVQVLVVLRLQVFGQLVRASANESEKTPSWVKRQPRAAICLWITLTREDKRFRREVVHRKVPWLARFVDFDRHDGHLHFNVAIFPYESECMAIGAP